MGQEVACRATIDGRRIDGIAQLETDELRFRGDERVRIRFSEIRSLEAGDGRLVVEHAGGTAVFELGKRADRWLERIRNPPTVVDKLGVSAGSRVRLVGVTDDEVRRAVRARAADVADGVSAGEQADVVVFEVESAAELGRIAELSRALAPAGGLWVVSPRGRSDVGERDVLVAGRSAGLVDTKSARFSDTHTAHRFQIPKDRR